MKVLLLNIDSKLPNLALKKIEMWHKLQGDAVIWDMPIMLNIVDKVYVSCVFSWNRHKAENYGGLRPTTLIGGSGWDLDTTLPGDIEEMKPRINYGFTTRGCIRNCQFCVVPRKEGNIHKIGDIYDIWDGKSKTVVVMDNNILALPDHFKMICGQLRGEKLRVDFNQGLDHRLLSEDLWHELTTLRHIREIRFAFDDIAYKKTVVRALELMKRGGLKDWQTRWYVYVGKKDTLKTVYERLVLLKSYKQHAYLMRDKEVHDNPQWIAMATWTSFQGAFKFDLPRLLKENDRFKSYAKYFPAGGMK